MLPSGDSQSPLADLRKQVQELLAQQMFDSAELLAGVFVSVCREDVSSATNSGLQGVALEAYADALFGKGEYKRALNYYRQAAQQRKLSVPRFKVAPIFENQKDVELRYKECQCHIKLKDTAIALRDLELIPEKLRDLKTNVCLGKLYKAAGLRRNATFAFKEALRIHPTALEVIEPLIALGEDGNDLMEIIKRSCNSKSKTDSSFSSVCCAGNRQTSWLYNLISGFESRRSSDFETAEAAFSALCTTFPRTPYFMLQAARTAVESEKLAEAFSVFKQLRILDSKVIDCMDMYALVLQKRGEDIELNRLAHDLLNTDQKRPEPWLVVAVYSESRGDTEKALTFVDKAIQLDPRHALAFRMKGSLLLALDRPEQAVVAFFQANSFERDIASFAGLVRANLAVHKFNDALVTAKEALTSMPRSPVAYLLVGQVLSHTPEAREKAKKAYIKALTLSPRCVPAVHALSTLLIAEKKYDEAVKVLQDALETVADHVLRTQLGRVYALQHQFGAAVEQLHQALSLKPDSLEAAKELEHVERAMRGDGSGSSDSQAHEDQSRPQGNVLER